MSVTDIANKVWDNINPLDIGKKTVDVAKNTVSDLNPVQAIQSLESSLINEFKSIETSITSEVASIEKTFNTELNTIETTFSSLKDGVVTGFKDIGGFFSDFETKAEEFYTDDIKPVGGALFNLAKATLKTTEWLIIHYKLTLGVVGAYLTFRFINEAKQALN